MAHGPGYLLRLENGKAIMVLRDAAERPKDNPASATSVAPGPAKTLSMNLLKANRRARILGESQLKATASYFTGSDPRSWIAGVPTYARVSYKAVYPGIDLSFYGKESRLEYDFLLQPGADAGKIGFALQGADQARTDESGDLVLRVGSRDVKFLKPVAYQPGVSGDAKRRVDVSYRLVKKKGGAEELEFTVGAYDHAANLVIDPVLDYGTYLLASDSYSTGIAADASGNTYVLSEGNANGASCGFTVSKFDTNGNLLSNGTVTGSSPSFTGYPTAIAVSSSGSVYVTGFAGAGLPTTANAYQPANPNGAPGSNFNAFLAVLAPNGSTSAPALVPSYVSYLGGTYNNNGSGNDYSYAVAVDTQGDAYIVGITGGEPFPTTAGAYQTAYLPGATSAGFAAKFDPTKSGAASLVYSTLLGSTSDSPYGIAVDNSGQLYVTVTESSAYDIPVTSGAFEYSGYAGGPWVDIVKLNPAGTALVYSALLGPGSAKAIGVDGGGDAYVTGDTTAEDYPTTPGAYQTSYPDGFVTELNPAGTALIYSTFLSGPSGATNYSSVSPLSLALTPGCVSACNAYISGITSSTDLPLINAVQGYQGANPTGFVVELAGNGGSAVYSTYLGGVTAQTRPTPVYGGGFELTPAVATDPAGNAYITGNLTGNFDFPVTPNPVEPTGTLEDVYLAKIGPGSGSSLVAAPSVVTFSNGIVNVPWTTYPGGTQPTVTLLNTGSTALTLSSILAAPANEVAQTNNCNGAIDAGSSCVLTLNFTPESAGSVSGTVTVTTTASTVPVVVNVNGYGADQGFLQFSPASLSFPDQAVGTTGTAQTATLTNIGHTPVTNLTLNYYYGSISSSTFPEVNNCPNPLDPGQSCQVSVQFAPTATGLAANEIYNDYYDCDCGGQQLALSGTGIAPGAGGSGTSVVWPGTINMGSAPVGVDVTAPFYFTNTSATVPVTLDTATVALTSTIGSVNDFGVGPCSTLPDQVAAGSSCDFTVYFTPSVAGTETATITVTDSSASSPHTVTVSGVGVADTEVLEFTPANQVFADQPVGYQSATQTFYVYNTGTVPVTVDRSLVTGDFQITNDGCSGTTLKPPATPGIIATYQCAVSVAFTPSAIGARVGTLTLVDAATGNPQVLNLSGNGIAATGTLVVTPNTLTFPAQAVGVTSASETITLENPGNTPVTINSASVTGDYSESDYNCGTLPIALPPFSNCQLSVAFTPSSSTVNPRIGALMVSSSAGNQAVSLTGTGEAATQSIGFTPTTVNFGSIPVGTASYIYSVYIRNTGTEAVTFNAAATVSGNYSIASDQCSYSQSGVTLPAASSCLIELQLTPTATGAQTGTLTLTDTAGTGSQTLSLAGTGVATSTVVAMNAEAVNFSQQPVKTASSPQQIFLYNYGSSEIVNIASVSVTSGGTNFSIPAGYPDSCTGGQVPPGSYCYSYLQFNPTASGYLTGTITFVDTKGNKYAGALAGYSPVDANSAYLSPATYEFAAQTVGTTSNYAPSASPLIYLYNTGNAPLSVGTVTGTNYSAAGPSTSAEFSLDTSYEGDSCSGNSVPAGGSCYVQVQFTPNKTGGQTGSLNFPVTYTGTTTAVTLTANLSGTGVAAKNEAIVSPTTLSFPDQVVGTTSSLNQPQVVTLTNSGNLPFTVGTVAGTNYSAAGPSSTAEFSVNPNYGGDQCSGGTFSPGQSCVVGVQFTPVKAGGRSGTIVFPVTYSGATKAVNFTTTLSGNGIAESNSAYLAPTSASFGPVVVGQSAPSSIYTNTVFYIYNTGNLPLAVGTVTGTNYSAAGSSATAEFYANQNYYGDQCSGAPISPGQSCATGVQFTPVAAGNRSGTLVFPVTYSGATKAVNFTASLSGIGIADSNSAALSPPSTVFTDEVVGTSTPAGSYVVYLNNTGNQSFNVGTLSGKNYSSSGPSATAEFSLDTNDYGDQCSGAVLSPGQSCPVGVVFTPSATGNQTGTLVFPVTYAGATKPVNFTASLSGTGLATTTTLVLSQTSLAFGNQPVGTSSGQIGVTLTNYSANPLPVTSITLGGKNATDFSENDNCAGNTVGAGSNCNINITFTPALTSLGARTATVTEKDPGTGGTRTITLTGTGTADVSTVTFFPATTAFSTSETVNEGTPGKIVSLNFQGSVPLNITSVTSSDPTEFPVVQDGCSGQTVASGASCEVEISFAPTKTGALSATISVADSAAGSPQTFVVTGGAITQTASITTLTATPATAAFGSLFTLVATVKSGTTPVANGSVTFYDGTKAIGTAQVVTTTSGGGVIGTATLKTLYLPLGANSITAKYTGANATSTSAAATVTVTGKYPSSAVLSSTGTQGSYILTGRVEGGGPQTTLPTGKIAFTDNQTNTTLGTVALDATTLTQSFVNSSTPATGSNYPQTVTLADVNGDGKPDLLIGTGSLNGFIVALGNGDGTYQAPQTVVGNGYAANIVAADVNGDGKLDVILSNGANAGVFLGNGDGTFQGEVDYDSSVQFVAVGDVNGDGRLDLVTTGNGYNMDVLLGNGDGTFQDPVPVGSGYEFVGLGDFNGDGKLDIITNGEPDNGLFPYNIQSIAVLLGNGNGTFQAAKITETNSYNPSQIAISDLNSDGKLDIVVDNGGGSIGSLLGNGDGTFQTENVIETGGFGQHAVADINGDGKPDVIVPNNSGTTLNVFPGNGDGTFGSAVTYSTGNRPYWVAVADINNDGKPDLAVVNYQDYTTSVLLNQATQTAKLTGVTLPGVSADQVTGAYSGDTNYVAATTNTLTLASNPPGPGTTTLKVTPATGTLGTAFTLTATVVTATSAKITAGSVNFFVDGYLIANVELDKTTGVATLATDSLPVGTSSITAEFVGTDTNKPSSSAAVSVTVTGKYTTTTALSSTGVQGSYALSAVVDAFGLGSPTGSVVFTDNSTNTTLGTVPLTAAGLMTNFVPAATPTLPVGNYPYWVVAGDFNGDGKQDIAAANSGDNTVSVYFGNGDGTFGAQQTSGYVGYIYSLTTGDFNGDGKLDIAVATTNNAAQGYVGILIGNGDGTFQPTVFYSVNAGNNPYPTAIVAADLNGDGKLDLAVANTQGGEMVSVLLGNGDGTFGTASSFGALHNGAGGVTVGDFNSDGKPDIAVSINGAAGVTVGIFLGVGDGTFGAETDFAAGGPNGTARAITSGDLNLDGKLDLAVADDGGAVCVLFGNGDGTFNASQSYPVGGEPNQPVIADVNGDGNPDLVVSTFQAYDRYGQSGPNSVAVLLGNGTAGTLQSAQNIQAANVGNVSVAVADFNGDGRPDIVSAEVYNSQLSILIGSVTEGFTLTGVTLPGSGADNVTAAYTGDTVFAGSTSNALTLPSHPPSTTTTLSANPTAAALGALVTLTATVKDANSNPVTGGSVSFYNGTTLLATVQLVSATNGNSIAGTATYTTRALPAGTDSLTAQFTGTDTNGPSTSTMQTVTVSGQYPTTTTLSSTGTRGNYTLSANVQAYSPLTPTGKVTFTDTTASTTLGQASLSGATFGVGLISGTALAGASEPDTAAVGDFNGDGKPDLAITNFYGPISVFLGNGDGTFQTPVNYAAGSGPADIVSYDVNGDGKLDLVYVNYEGNTVGVLLGNGDGTFQAEQTYGAGNGPGWIGLGDFNGDGKIDLAVPDYRGNTVSVLLGNGDGTFQPAVQYPLPSGPNIAAVGDFNGDGKLDLAVSQYNGTTVSIMLGNGDGTFQSPQPIATGSGPEGVVTADFNHDGKLDLAVANFNDNTVSILIGKGDGTFATQVTYATGKQPDALAIGDINGDANMDLVVANNGDNSVSILLGNADGTLGTQQAISVGSYPETPTLGDINSDGRLDIVVPNVLGDTTSILLNQASDTVTLTGVNVAGTGTHNVTATYAGDANFTGSTSPSIELAATLASSSIALTAQPSASVAYASPLSVLVTVTGQSGTNVPTGNVTYTIDGGAQQTAALIAGTTSATDTLNLAGLAVGSHKLVVNYAGDQVHAAAPSETLTLTITKASQTITYNNTIGNTTYGDGPFGISATSTSGLTVTISVVSGPATISGSTVTVTGAGTVVLAANQAGNADYNPAPTVQQSFTAAKAPLSVAVTNATKVYGAANPAFTSTITGLVGTDTVTVTYSTTATTTSAIGTYPITATLSGAALPNYTATVTAGTLTITKQPLVVTVANASRAYGAANPTFTGTVTGLQGTDTVTVTYSTAATVTSPVAAGGYPITATVTGSDLGNYNVTVVPGTLTLNPAPLTITVGNATKVYGTANPAFTSTLAGVLNGDSVPVTYSTSATATTGAGSYAISASTTDANYTATVVPGTLTITQAPLTILVNSFTKVYGSANPTFTGTVKGLLFNDTVTTTYQTTAVQFSYVGGYPITASISGGASANYAATVTNGTLTITQTLLQIVVNNGTKVYGTVNPAFTGTVTGILNNDAVVVSYSSPATVRTTVGAYPNITASISGAPAVNYSPQVTVGTLTITPAALTVTVAPATKIYGSANPTFTDTFVGLVNGDTLTSSYATTATAASPIGTYPVTLTLSGALLPNYTPTITNGVLTITPAPLMVVVANASRLYGAANPAFTGTITGQQNGDVITATYSTAATAASSVGTYPITATLAGANLGNYTPMVINGVLTVTPAPLTVVVASASRLYGAANQAFTGTITGLQNGDVITATYSTAATAASSVGTYPITATLAGANLGNYTPMVTTGVLTVTPAPLTVVVASASRLYGAANQAFTGTITGLQNGDVITATYSTTATVTSGVGTYAITGLLAGTNLGDYAPTVTDGTLTITKAPLTVVVANASRLYGAANPAFTGTITGLKNGDVITATYSTTATVTSAVGTYAITTTLAGKNLGDYAPTITDGKLTIAKAPLTVKVANASRVYGAANPSFTGTITGQKNGDVITATYSTTATAASSVGTYPITATLAGKNLADYTPTIANGTLTVTKATQTITFANPGTQGGSPLTLSASATSGLAVTFTSTTSAICTVSGTTATFIASGTCTVDANQAGNNNYAAATTVAQTFPVTFKPPVGNLEEAVAAATGTTTIQATGSLFVSGWTADPVDGSPLSNVKVYIDGTSVGTPTLGISRPDVASYYNNPAYGKSGYNLTYSATLLSAGTHAITVVAVNSHGLSTTFGPLTVTVVYPPPVGNLEQAVDLATGATTIAATDSLFVSGWAADPIDGSPLSNVKIYIDGTSVGTPTLGISRPDVASYFNNPAYGKSGYNFTYSASLLSTGTHLVTVAAVNSHGVSTTFGPLTITVTAVNRPPVGSLDYAGDSVSGQPTISRANGTLLVSGWAADYQDNGPAKTVQILIDGELAGLATLGLSRPDVAAYFNNPAWLYTGYSFSTAVTGLSPGTHSVTAVATDSLGLSTALGPLTITITTP